MNGESVWAWLMQTGWRLGAILALTLLGLLLVNWLGHRIQRRLEHNARLRDTREELLKRAHTLHRFVQNGVRFVLLLVALVLALGVLDVDLGPILAGAGVAGIALGFGAQQLLRDYFNGFFILIENQYRVGDVIRAGGVSGLVEAVNLRTTVLRDLEGHVHTIPNGQVSVVTNLTKGFSRYVLDVGVAYKEDVDSVIALLGELGQALQLDPRWAPDLTEPLEVLGVQDFADSAVVIRVRLTTKPMRQWDLVRELRRRIKVAFDAHGIEIPFPHRTLYQAQHPRSDT